MSNLNYNHVIMAGRLTGDPEVKMTNSGTNMVTVNVAVNRQAKQGEEQKADFFRCIAWGQTAQFVAQHFRKGAAILIDGRIQTGSYTDQSGVKRYTTDVVIERAQFVDSRAEAGQYQPQAPAPAPAQTPIQTTAVYTQAVMTDMTDEDQLPF